MKSKDERGSSLGLGESFSEAATHKPQDALVGQLIGKYRILSNVAKGGSATVYRALDTVLNREVAFKILHEHHEGKADVTERFKKEAQLIAQLRHPNIVNVFDFFDYNGRAVLVAEFVAGMTLSDLIKNVPKIPEDFVLMIGLEMLQGLKAAHEKGMTHRDIKPANILLNAELGIKISDFGLAKLVHTEDGLTKTGVFVGTPSFSSPEQIEGKPIDHRSDLFSLGLTLYILATRAHAFKKHGDSTTTVFFKIVRGQFESARSRNPDLSKAFEKILDRSLEVVLEKRYQSADEMITDISHLLSSRGLIPYQTELKAFLKNPAAVKGTVWGRKFPPFFQKFIFWGGLCLLGLASVLWVARLKTQGLIVKKSPFVEIKSLPRTGEATPLPILNAPEATPALKISTPPYIPKPENIPKVTEKKNTSRTEEPVKIPELGTIHLPKIANLIWFGSSNLPSFQMQWKGGNHLKISSDANFTTSKIDVDSKNSSWILDSLRVGSYFWKAGSESGQFNVSSFDSYKSSFELEKHTVVVSTQFGDVDLQLNPYRQILKFVWPSGPEAASYKLQLASDAGFQNLIFASPASTKSITIERMWDRSQTLYWRVSYLDETKNVFLVEDSHRLHIRLQGNAPYFELLQSKDPGIVRISGPLNASIRCSTFRNGRNLSGEKTLTLDADSVYSTHFITNEIPDYLVCEMVTNSKRQNSDLFILPYRR